MSAVTASIIVGSRHRKDPGIQPRWLVLLHEGQNYAWHLVRLQLTGVPGPPGLDVAPGVLWRSSGDEHLVEELALMLHLFATGTSELTEAVRHCPSLKRNRVDLDALDGRERGDVDNALRLAAEHGRELMLAVTIHRESRLTEEALLSMPDWELDVAHTAMTRHWTALEGMSLVDYRQLDGQGVDHETSYEDWIDGRDDDPFVGAHAAPDTGRASRSRDAARNGRPGGTEGATGTSGSTRSAAAAGSTGSGDGPDSPDGGPAVRTHLELDGGTLRPARLGWMRRQPKPEGQAVRRKNSPVVGRPVREKVGLAEFFGFDDDRPE